MTIIVEPSESRGVINSETGAATNQWAGRNWIVPSNIDINATALGLSGTPLNAAAVSTSGLDVTIDTFEAFIGGAWVGSDDSSNSEHTHTLAGNSTTTTLYLGWDFSSADTIIFGPAGDFASADYRIPIVDVTDDGSSVTDQDDRRALGPVEHDGVLVAATIDTDDTTALTLDTGTLSDTYDVYRVHIYREPHGSGQDYQDIRLNGVSTNNYNADFYDAENNDHTSYDDVSEFGKIAGVNDNSGAFGGFCYQILRFTCPTELVSNGRHYPQLEAERRGVGKNVDYVLQGSLAVDSTDISRINLFGGVNSTGVVLVTGHALGYAPPTT